MFIFVYHDDSANIVISVFEIVLQICEGIPWKETLMNVLPLRKGAYACGDSIGSNGSDSET